MLPDFLTLLLHLPANHVRWRLSCRKAHEHVPHAHDELPGGRIRIAGKFGCVAFGFGITESLCFARRLKGRLGIGDIAFAPSAAMRTFSPLGAASIGLGSQRHID